MYAAPLQKQQQMLWSELETQLYKQDQESARFPRVESFYSGEAGTLA
jgi:hypothetical protein